MRSLTMPSDVQRARRPRILVATDGTAASEGALAVAALLARRDGHDVDVVSVLERWGSSPPDEEFVAITGELLDARLSRVIAQSERAFDGTTTSWTVRVIDSSRVGDTIARIARAEGHALIVTGLPGSWFQKWLRRRTALDVARRSAVPVLAVPRSVATLPAPAVVGVTGRDADASSSAHLTDHARCAGADLIVVDVPKSGRGFGGVARRVTRAADRCVLLRGPGSTRGAPRDAHRSPGLASFLPPMGIGQPHGHQLSVIE